MNIGYLHDTSILSVPNNKNSQEIKDAYEMHRYGSDTIACIMLSFMIAKLQQQNKMMDALSMIMHLKELFNAQSRMIDMKYLKSYLLKKKGAPYLLSRGN